MTKKLKIAIAVGSTLAVGVGGYLLYRRYAKKNEIAKEYLREVDENGGNPPVSQTNQPSGRPNLAPTTPRFTRNLAIKRAEAISRVNL